MVRVTKILLYMKSTLKIILALVVVIIASSAIYLSSVTSITSAECIVQSKAKCPDGIASYKHVSSTWSDDICECECK